MELPKCQKCNNGLLIPLSDYGQEGASVMFKAWVCTNPDCGFSLRVDKGDVTYGKKIEHNEGALRIAHELTNLNESLNALAYAALGQQAPNVRRRRTG